MQNMRDKLQKISKIKGKKNDSAVNSKLNDTEFTKSVTSVIGTKLSCRIEFTEVTEMVRAWSVTAETGSFRFWLDGFSDRTPYQ